MSEILNRLKQAEAERERVIAERRRLEAEADAALAQREREEQVLWQRGSDRPLPAREPAPQTPQQRSRFAAGVAMAVAMGVVFWIGTLVPRAPAPLPAPVRAPEPVVAAKPQPPALFKLDRDLEAFARRVGDRS